MPIKISKATKEKVEKLLKENNDLLSAYHKNEKVDLAPLVAKVDFKGIVSFEDIKKEPEYKDIEVLNGFCGAYENILKQAIISEKPLEEKDEKPLEEKDEKLLEEKDEKPLEEKGEKPIDDGFVQLPLEKYVALHVEYKIYTNVIRLKNARDIKTAREFGDLSENAEYQIAREQQGLIEARIAELKAITDNCVIVDPKDSYDVAEPGATITVKNLTKNTEKTYMLVGTTESDIGSNPPKISNASPLGKALLGKKKGDKFVALIGKSRDTLEIIDIK